MTRFHVIATAKYGAVDPPQLLDDAGQWQALQSYEAETAALQEVLRQRATRRYQLERDPMWDGDSREPIGRTARMVELARKARVA